MKIESFNLAQNNRSSEKQLSLELSDVITYVNRYKKDRDGLYPNIQSCNYNKTLRFNENYLQISLEDFWEGYIKSLQLKIEDLNKEFKNL